MDFSLQGVCFLPTTLIRLHGTYLSYRIVFYVYASTYLIWFQVPPLKSALSPLRTIKKDEQDSFSFRKDRNRPLSGKSDPKPLFTPKPLFSQNSMTKGSDKTRGKRVDLDDYSSLLDDDSEPLQETLGFRSGTDTKFGSSLDYNLSSHDQRMESSSSSVIGRFTIDKVKKIDIDSQAKRLDSDGVINSNRSSDRFLKSGRAEFSLSGIILYIILFKL